MSSGDAEQKSVGETLQYFATWYTYKETFNVPKDITVHDFVEEVFNSFWSTKETLHYSTSAGKDLVLSAMADSSSILMVDIVPPGSTVKLREAADTSLPDVPELKPQNLSSTFTRSERSFEPLCPACNGTGILFEDERCTLCDGVNVFEQKGFEDKLQYTVSAHGHLEREIAVPKDIIVKDFISHLEQYFIFDQGSAVHFLNPSTYRSHFIDLFNPSRSEEFMKQLVPNGSDIILQAADQECAGPAKLRRAISAQSGTSGSPGDRLTRAISALSGTSGSPEESSPSLRRCSSDESSSPVAGSSKVALENTWVKDLKDKVAGLQYLRGPTLKCLQEALGCSNPFCPGCDKLPEAKDVTAAAQGLDIDSEDAMLHEVAGHAKSMRFANGWLFPSCTDQGMDMTKMKSYPKEELSKRLQHEQIYQLLGKGKTYSYEEVKSQLDKAVDVQVNAWKVEKFKYAFDVPAARENDERYKIRQAAILLGRFQSIAVMERLAHLERIRTMWEKGWDANFDAFGDSSAQAVGIEDTGKHLIMISWADCEEAPLSAWLDEARMDQKLSEREWQQRLYVKDSKGVLMRLPLRATPSKNQFPLELKLKDDRFSIVSVHRPETVVYHLQGAEVPQGKIVRGKRNMASNDLKRAVGESLGWPVDDFVISELWGRRETEVHLKISKVSVLRSKVTCRMCGKLLTKHTEGNSNSSAGLSTDSRKNLKHALTSKLDEQPVDQRAACYETLLKIFTNLIAKAGTADEAKFRTLKSSNKVLKEKVFGVPGGVEVLMAAGCEVKKVGDDTVYVLAAGEHHREIQAILWAHVRQWLVECAQRWIQDFDRAAALPTNDCDSFMMESHGKIGTTLEKLANMCDFTRTVKDRVDGAVASFKSTESAQVASTALQGLLNSFVEQAFRTFAYDEQELCYDTPGAHGQSIGEIPAGMNVLLIRDGRLNEWAQVLQVEGWSPDCLIHARRCRLHNGNVCPVFIEADDIQVLPLMLRLSEKEPETAKPVPDDAADGANATAASPLDALLERKRELQVKMEKGFQILKAARASLEQETKLASSGTLVQKLESKVKEAEHDNAKLEGILKELLQEIDSSGMVPVDVTSADENRAEIATLKIELTRTRTRSHPVFENPRQATCWLSCVFQALWHSPVFQYAFEKHYLRTYELFEDSDVLVSFREVWATVSETISAQPRKSINLEKLAEAMHVTGWGDSSEALNSLEQAFACSDNPIAQGIARGIVPSVSVMLMPSSPIPTPQDAWKSICELRVQDAPLIAVEITPQTGTSLDGDAVGTLADTWIPRFPELCSYPNLGRSHKVVALVCYIDSCRHYVAFCGRRSDPRRCRFFNDLPKTTLGAPLELAWDAVPVICNQFCLQLRFVLYESTYNVSLALKHCKETSDVCIQM